MSLTWLWERDEGARQAMLAECLAVFEGGGPNPVRQKHLACAMDWALRERARADALENVVRRYCKDASQALADSLDLATDMAEDLECASGTEH